MDQSQTSEDLKQNAEYLRLKWNILSERIDSLPEATGRDLEPKVGRIRTMIEALERDAKEVDKPIGASAETARELRSVLDTELERLEQETETLEIGAPTTVTTALDAILHVVERAEGRLRKLTGRVQTVRKQV